MAEVTVDDCRDNFVQMVFAVVVVVVVVVYH